MLTREETAKAILPYIGRDFTVTKVINDPYNMLCKEGSVVKITPILIQLILEGNIEGVAHIQSLSAITDEHAVEVAKIINVSYSNNQESEAHFDITELIFFIGELLEYKGDVHDIASWNVIKLFQYLISQGYAVPLWFGINHPCNGKTAIDLGIAIIKQ